MEKQLDMEIASAWYGKTNNYKSHFFENINSVVVYFCSTKKPPNQIFFSFPLKLLTVRTLMISLRLLISTVVCKSIGTSKPQRHVAAKLEPMHDQTVQIALFHQRNTLLHQSQISYFQIFSQLWWRLIYGWRVFLLFLKVEKNVQKALNIGC